MLRMQTGQASHIGRRERNEDAVKVVRFPHLTLCLVADGMGGGEAGALIGRNGIELITRDLCCRLSPVASSSEVELVLRRAFSDANQAILQDQALGRRTVTTMTLVAWRILYPALSFGHVGNGRGYRIRGTQVEQLTRDHTIANAFVQSGTLTPEQPGFATGGHSVTRYLGHPDCSPDLLMLTPQAGDCFLLSTDGLHHSVRSERLMQEIREHTDLQACADYLCQLAIAQGSRDNASCIVMKFVEDDTQQPLDSFPMEPGWLAWKHGFVEALARSIRAENRFEDLPILADALQDAGCTNEALLAHCREPGEHVSGCWALEALLTVR